MDLLFTSSVTYTQTIDQHLHEHKSNGTMKALTLNLSDGAQKDILLCLLILQALEDLLNYRFAQLSLLAFLLLLLISCPAV